LKQQGINAPNEEVERVLDPTQVMLSYESRGGTGKKAVEKVIKDSRSELESFRAEIKKDKARVDTAFNACRSIAKDAGAGIKDREQLKKLIEKYRPQSFTH